MLRLKTFFTIFKHEVTLYVVTFDHFWSVLYFLCWISKTGLNQKTNLCFPNPLHKRYNECEQDESTTTTKLWLLQYKGSFRVVLRGLDEVTYCDVFVVLFSHKLCNIKKYDSHILLAHFVTKPWRPPSVILT